MIRSEGNCVLPVSGRETFRREKQRRAGIWEYIGEKASRAVVNDNSRPEECKVLNRILLPKC